MSQRFRPLESQHGFVASRDIEDEDTLHNGLRSGSTEDNNQYLRSAGSTDTVVIPARPPTVPPPPITHRVPRLEDQDPAFRARQREMFQLYRTGAIRQESSHDSSQSTDSGEYTIRDGSPRSSGHHHSSRNSDHVEHGSVSSSPRAPVSLVLATAAAASSLQHADGASTSPVIYVSFLSDGILDLSWTLGLGVVIGWIGGMLTFWCFSIVRVDNSQTLLKRHLCTVWWESAHAPRNA